MGLQDKSMFDPCFGNGVHDHGEDSFNEILSILDFPMESLEGENLTEDWASNLGPLPTEFLRELPPVAQGLGVENGHLGGSCMLPHESLVGCKTSRKLKREPAFIDEASKLGTPLVPFDHSFFQASSPVSVLESGSSNSSGKRQSIGSETSVRTKRARTKYARSRAPRSWLMRSLVSVYQIFQSKRLEEEANRKKPSPPQLTKDAKKDPVPKKCTHCGITKTPQWREGPKGPKTLCNACGVRYRSGRLFPEYRPAASPTFIPSVHSNSHRKVLAMREKAAVPKMQCSVPELDSMNHSLLKS